MKKFLILTLALVMLLSLSVSPALAVQSSSVVTAAVDPGNIRWDNTTYNYAWLDNMIIRDDPMASAQAHIIPKPTDYPYSTTYEQFLEDSGNYKQLITLDKDTVASAYDEVVNVMYYLVVAMGMTDDINTMKQYLTDNGIRIPANTTPDENGEIAVVYAAMKYDAVYTLYGKHVTFPVGTTLDGAVVTIVSALTGTVVPSGVENLAGYALFCTKTYVTSFDSLPVSTNPSEEEIFHWAKVILAAESGDYQVPVEVYSETSAAQKEYVDYAYYASILSDLYDVKIDPIKLIVAIQDGDPLSVQKLILKTMLDEKKVSYADNMACEDLFDLACESGCFNLEEEFYTDVLRYEIEVAQNCEKIWFTAFALSGLLPGGSDEYLSLKLAGNAVAPSSTTGITLNPAMSTETIYLESTYNAPDRQETAVYEFKIVKNAALNTERNPETKNDMVAEVEKYVNSIVPVDSDKASTVIDGVFQSVDSAMQNGNSQVGEGILTTYGTDVSASAGSVGAATGTTDSFDFNYLDDLLNGVYETDENGNIITTTAFDYERYTTTEKASIVEKTVQTVKENPEIVAAPTGLIAVGAFAGYLLTKKHRDSEDYLESEEETEE
jgi:hypothetical protein